MCVVLKILEDLRNEGTYGFFPQYDEDVGRATGSTEIRKYFISNLSRILQLTGNYILFYKIGYEFVGFSDPMYAEEYVEVHGFNITYAR